MKKTCCLNCHFLLEEHFAFPYLPPKIRRKLEISHAILRAKKFPRRAVEKHSKREEKIYRRYCPKEVFERIEKDHQDYEDGKIPTYD